MAKAHWTSRFDMQIARQTLAERAKGMLQRSGMLSDVEVIGERRIRVGYPDGFDETTDPLGQAAEYFRENKIDALARVLGLRYTIERSYDEKSIFVFFST
jgi:hypothetical protein